MSRRITFAALAASGTLIASATLIATHAVADRECFEDSCRMQEAVEAQAPPESAAAAASSSIPDFVTPETAAKAADADATEAKAEAKPVVVVKPEPVTAPPSVVAKPEPKVEPKVEPSLVPSATTRLQPYAPPPVAVKSEPDVVLPRVTTEPAVRRPPQIVQPQNPPRRDEPRTKIPQYVERPQPPVAQPAPVRPARTVPPAAATVERAPIAVQPRATSTYADRAPAYAPPPRPVAIDVPRQAPSVASAAVIEVPGEIQTGDGLVTVYPNLRPDPAWKLCQIDSRDLGRRAYRCTAYSYHPYGEGGYRPYGTYRNYPTAPGYVMAPNARIISIDPND